MNNVLVRELHENDESAIQAIALRTWGNDAEAMKKRPLGWNRQAWAASHADVNRKDKTTLVAELEGKLVAVGSIIYNDFYRVHVAMNIDPAFSTQKAIGTKLFNALHALATNQNYLIREWKDDPTHPLELYETLGFRFAERCTEGWVNPNQTETSAWITSRLLAVPKEIAVSSEQHPIPLTKQVAIVHLLDKRHKQLSKPFDLPTYATSSIKPSTDAELIKQYLERSIPGTLFCVYVDNELVDAGLLTKSIFGEDESSGHFVWGGVADFDRPDAYAITEALIAHILDSARQLGLRVQVEFANHHLHKHRCIHSIPGTDLVEDMVLMVRDAPP